MINTWHCDDSTCNGLFYTDLGIEPNKCPFCGSYNISDSKVFELKEVKFSEEKEETK
jgi:hypothetical protein